MPLKKIFRRKSVASLNLTDKNNQLSKTLSLFQLVCLGVGMVIGAGIFVLTGLAAGEHAGPAVTLSFTLAGLVCICAGFCYAEFASMINVAGSSYSYIYMSFGELPAFITGVMTILGYFFGSITAITGWSGYFMDLLADFNIYLPEYLLHATGHLINYNGVQIQSYLDLPALVFTLIVTILLLSRVESSSFVTSFLVVLKLIVLVIFVIIGSSYIDFNHFTPYIPPNAGEYGQFGLSGVVVGATMVFLAFNGFDAVCTAAQEAKNPRKNIPLGVLITIVLVTLIYISAAFVLTGIVNYKELCIPQSFTVALDKINIPWFNYLIKTGAIAGLGSVIIVSIFTVVRMLLVMASDKLLPSFFAVVDKKTKAPFRLTLFVGVLMAVIASVLEIDFMIRVSSFLILLSLLSVCAGAIFMRYDKPNLKRGFKCPYMPFLPSIAIVLILYMLAHYPLEIYLSILVIFLFLLCCYFLFKYERRPTR
jgi:APA family basic amino acid/polyamine antiporter